MVNEGDGISVTIEGTVEDIIYHNDVNSYTVCEIMCAEELVTAVGYMPFVNQGESLRVTGKWVKHPDYGEQLKVGTYEKVMPTEAHAIERYLASGAVKYIGVASARKIVERFGADSLDVIRLYPSKLAGIKGIGLDRALKIGHAFEEQRGLMKVVMFFQKYDISLSYAAKAYKFFGDNAIDEIKTNPYRLADEIFGIGFKTADKIALSLGIDPMSRIRISSGMKYILSHASMNGHVYLPEDKLQEYTRDLIGVEMVEIDEALVSLSIDKSIRLEEGSTCRNVYLSPLYYAELGVTRKLAELKHAFIKMEAGKSCSPEAGKNDSVPAASKDYVSAKENENASVTGKNCVSVTGTENSSLQNIYDKIASKSSITLADEQKTAVKEALVNGVLIITGGPGTGKTTIIKNIIALMEKQGLRVELAAPTGRAAKRMSEATGYEARTIHRLLEIEFMGEEKNLEFARNESNPIEADALIIDEMSMVDLLLMNHLLKAITPGTRLILVGDVDQLPSVGPGSVLRDIIASGTIRTIRLTEIFRQEEESMIIINAHKINRGEYPVLNARGKDFFFIPRSNGDDIVKTILELYSRRLPDTYGYNPMKNIQVLTPVKKGITGVFNLNVELQKILNPISRGKCEKVLTKFTFREGDKVMQIRNNYSLAWTRNGQFNKDGTGVFNGDTGIISDIDEEEQRVTVIFDDDKIVEYDFNILDEIEPAFAVTIHKSQGSEFPAVLIPLFQGPSVLLTRNLLYTAVTRARNIVVLIGSENILRQMIDNEKEAFRYTGLSIRLERAFKPI